jgi:Zn finger protein HypA/HybF involved in hydrogenase expression
LDTMNRYHSGPVTCPKCGHDWPKVLLDGMPIRCPSCGSVAEVALEYAPVPFSVHHDRGQLIALTDMSSRSGYSSLEGDVEQEAWEVEDLRTRPGGMALATRLLIGFVGAALMLEEIHRFGGMSTGHVIAITLVSIAVAWPVLLQAAIFLYGATLRYQIGTVVCELCGHSWKHVVLDGHPKLCPNCARYTRKPLVLKQLTLAEQLEQDDSDSHDPDLPRVAATPPKPIQIPKPVHVSKPAQIPKPLLSKRADRHPPWRRKHS